MTKRCSFSVYITGKCQICCCHIGDRFVLRFKFKPSQQNFFTFPCVLLLFLLVNVSLFCLLGLNYLRQKPGFDFQLNFETELQNVQNFWVLSQYHNWPKPNFKGLLAKNVSALKSILKLDCLGSLYQNTKTLFWL